MNLRDQFDGPDSRTWLWHGSLCAVTAVLFIALLILTPERGRWMLPAVFAAFVYWFLELRGWPYSGKRFLAWLGVGRERRDHIMDVASPTVTALVVSWVGWFVLGLRW